MTPYACADVHYTYLLFKKFIIEVAKHESLKKLYINEMSPGSACCSTQSTAASRSTSST
jgi:hypothetical protein